MKPYELKPISASRLIAIGLLTLSHFIPTTAAEANSNSNIGLKLLVEGLGAPETLVAIPDGTRRLLVAEQAGLIQVLDQDGKESEQPFLDLREKIVPLGKGMEERGLLGLALHPQFKSNHKLVMSVSNFIPCRGLAGGP